MGRLTVEWESYEMPSYGFATDKGEKFGIVGGLGVVSDEILSRISGEVNVVGVGVRHLRGRDLPIYEELDGYRVVRPLYGLYPDESIRKCRELFQSAGMEFSGVHVAEIPYLPFLSDYGLAIPDVRFREGPDLICAHDWMAILGGYDKSQRLKIPFVAFLHSLESGRQAGMVHTALGPVEAKPHGYYAGSRTIRDIEILGLRKCDVCFTVGKTMVRELMAVGKMHGVKTEDIAEKVFPIHHGVDTKVFRPMSVEKEYDIIFVGRFSLVKGVLELLDAVRMLKAVHPDIKARLIGGGELERAIVDKIKAEYLQDNVSLDTRWFQKKEKALEINKARIAVAPSKYEPHGQFDLEAGACGVPAIIGTGGLMERMVPGVTALQCDPFSPRDIAEKINSLLEKQEKAEEIGSNAREFVEKYFDWDERARIYPKIFDAVAGKDIGRLKEIPLVVNVEETEFAAGTSPRASERLG